MAKPKTQAAPDDPGADVALPRPPGAVQRWLDRHPRLVDWTIAVVCEAPLLLIGVVMPATGTGTPLQTASIIFTAVIGFVVLLFRRRFPLIGTAVLAVIAFAGSLLPIEITVGGWIDMFVLLYSLGTHSTTKRMWLGYGIASLAPITSGIIIGFGGPADEYGPLATTTGTPMAILYLVPTLIGMTVGGRRRYIAAIIARAEDLARERDQRARLAVTEERARVAREMHDIVSHGLTVMVTLSEGAAAQADAGASGAPEAMRKVASAGRDALADMRRLLGLLRDPNAPAELAPQPSAGDLDQLITGFRDAGLPVRWTHSGPPLDSEDSGRTDIPLTAYRIIQEGLTNVLRHATSAASVEVSLENGADDLVITIENSRPTRPTDDGSDAVLRRGDPTGDQRMTADESQGVAAPDALSGILTTRSDAADIARRGIATHVDRGGGDSPPAGADPHQADSGDSDKERLSGVVAGMRGAGRGLIGARERAALHDGTLEAGPTVRGGWRLRALLRKDGL